MLFCPASGAGIDGLTPLGVLPPVSALASVPLLSTGADNPGTTTMSSWSQLRPLSAVGCNPTVPRVGTPTASVATPTAAFCLSPASAPFPRKLVDKIQSGQYVEMRELLTDNITLLQQLDSLNSQHTLLGLPGVCKPRLREITSLPTWIFCFLAYAAIQCPDERTRDILAYGRLIVREAQKLGFGGMSWIDYDRVFRQQAAIDPTLQWNTLHPGIQASTLVGTPMGAPTFCTLCRGVDHKANGCALAYLQQPPPQATTLVTSSAAVTRRSQSQGSRTTPRRRATSFSICSSWNSGRCIFPGTCTFRHVCSICYRDHRAAECNQSRRDGNAGGLPRSTSHGQ